MDGPAWRLLLWGLSSWRFRKRSAMVSPSYSLLPSQHAEIYLCYGINLKYEATKWPCRWLCLDKTEACMDMNAKMRACDTCRHCNSNSSAKCITSYYYSRRNTYASSLKSIFVTYIEDIT